MLQNYGETLENYRYIQKILNDIKVVIDSMIADHCKVLIVRFDLHFPAGTFHQGRNDEISDFIKALTNYYTDQGIVTRYLWAREQRISDAPHYHVVFLLNGSRVQHPMNVWTKAAEIWSRITDGPPALVHRCWATPIGRDFNGGIMVRRPSGRAFGHDLTVQQQAYASTYGKALEWLSYLAKENSKDNTPFRVRRYGSSRL